MTADERSPRLGAVIEDGGVRFTLFSRHATAVELCLFASAEAHEERRVDLERRGGGLWSARVEGTAAGQLYGYRVSGPYRPGHGDRFNPAKLLVDPYARALTGEPGADPRCRGWAAEPEGDEPDHRDSAPAMPRSIVVADRDPARSWQRPGTSWERTVIYECHVKGMTKRHPGVPEPLRGTYLGLAQPAVIEHLQKLGVTAVELLPVQQFASEPNLLEAGLSNYFGYNPLALFAPHAGWASAADGRQVEEFRQMVRALHRAGLEVLVDVVFNHTAEGDRRGPTYSWRGIDNRAYYRLDPADPGRYLDFSGCGNTLDASSPAVERLVLDCLRHWVEQLGVDGFRFDLAASLGRDANGRYRAHGSLLERIATEPGLAGIKLIAEPWDLGPKGYRAGQLGEPWREWNDRYRDAVRSYWRGDPGRRPALALALAGSPDRFAGRRRAAAIDYVTCHDGFTLADLVSYERKHNEANLEGGRDGAERNLSRNWGAEGPTADPGIRRRRQRARDGMLACLAFTAGVPMLSHGDELGRSQAGNNNAYCHDSELTWIDWSDGPESGRLLQLVQRLFALRRRLGIGEVPPIEWLGPDAEPLAAGGRKALAGAALGGRLRTSGADLLLLLNGGEAEVLFQLPGGGRWQRLLSTADPLAPASWLRHRAVRLLPSSVVLLRYEEAAGPASSAGDDSGAAGESSRNS